MVQSQANLASSNLPDYIAEPTSVILSTLTILYNAITTEIKSEGKPRAQESKVGNLEMVLPNSWQIERNT